MRGPLLAYVVAVLLGSPGSATVDILLIHVMPHFSSSIAEDIPVLQESIVSESPSIGITKKCACMQSSSLDRGT